MGKVEFNAENVAKCQCVKCPVQVNSECFKNKLRGMQEMMSEDVDIATVIEPKDVPGVYCANGKTNCTGLNTHEICMCGECPIWMEYELNKGEPGSYFCKDGAAK